ncbi:hypothetical protein C2S51_029203 [Perilla frutescens var. frutescens]|nr:hypothetical protein C2S51_029203 [Perilla frutescens var. frutescens]
MVDQSATPANSQPTEQSNTYDAPSYRCQFLEMQQQLGLNKHIEVATIPKIPKPSLSGIVPVSEEFQFKSTPKSVVRKSQKSTMSSLSPVKLMLPMKMVGEVPQSWFINLWDIEGWLSNKHIESRHGLLVVGHALKPYDGTFCSENINPIKERIMQYVEGSYLEFGGLPWHEAEKIYGIGHVNENHWVLYVISINEQDIKVYDSLSKKLEWAIIEHTFNVVRRNLQWLCEVGGV